MCIERKKGDAETLLRAMGTKGYRLLWATREIAALPADQQKGDFLQTALSMVKVEYQKEYPHRVGARICQLLFRLRLVDRSESDMNGQSFAPNSRGNDLIDNVKSFAKSGEEKWTKYLRPSNSPNVFQVSPATSINGMPETQAA